MHYDTTGGTMSTMTIDPDDQNEPALPVMGTELRLHDGTTARVLQSYDPTLSRVMTGHDQAWQVTGPEGVRVIDMYDIAEYVEDEQTAGAALAPVEIPGTDTDHVVARVLNAAINWENATQNATSLATMIEAGDALHAAIRAYMPLVAK
jgi:hypothetical protein